VVGVERLLDEVAALELRIRVGEADAQAVRIEQHAGGGQAGALQRALDAREQRVIDLDGGLAAGYLDRRRFAEEIRQRVEQRERDRERDQRVLPGGIAVHPI
jgi:hypothetical protein